MASLLTVLTKTPEERYISYNLDNAVSISQRYDRTKKPAKSYYVIRFTNGDEVEIHDSLEVMDLRKWLKANVISTQHDEFRNEIYP
jgi:hypothetical protein